ncbi:hypothetical protein B9T39_03370 [Alloscardovia macacae]|uniref:Gram-positive cocci surface proteins LPxTG domain-containing protein n=1 Tax=Alloscardovia macacae TaxID=1160091 RepID=A0A1Y2T2D5_9BIFI|nr:hypothetical protein [Alloscardovia macacae]OTA29406.1 hypothetical protein B9T39_03370 [Alloscardovia macacae]
MNKVLKAGVTAVASLAMLMGMAAVLPTAAHADDATTTACPAAPTKNADGSLSGLKGDGYEWRLVYGRYYAIGSNGQPMADCEAFSNAELKPTSTVKTISCPAAPTLTESGSLPAGGEGYDWVPAAGRVYAVAKKGYQFAGEDKEKCGGFAHSELKKAEPATPTPTPTPTPEPQPQPKPQPQPVACAVPAPTKDAKGKVTVPTTADGSTWVRVSQTGAYTAVTKSGKQIEGCEPLTMKELKATSETTPDKKPDTKPEVPSVKPGDDSVKPADKPVPADSQVKLTLASNEVVAGQELEVSFSGLEAGKAYSVWFRSTPVLIGSFTATGETFTGRFTIPANAEAGEHHIVLTLEGSDAPLAEAALTVKKPAKVMKTAEKKDMKTTADKLAQTGTDIIALAGLSMMAVLGGAVVVLKTRARR